MTAADGCARDRIVAAVSASPCAAIWTDEAIGRIADDVLDALGIDRGMSLEPRWLLRRTDGEDLFDEFTNQVVHSPDDWESAEIDSSGEEEPVEYEMVTHVYTHVTTRTYVDGEQLAVQDTER